MLASTIVVRIGSVLVSLYLVQILVGFSRYHFRLADHLEACANGLAMYGSSKPDELVAVVNLLSPSNIDFGKPPDTPSDKLLDVVKEALSKVKT